MKCSVQCRWKFDNGRKILGWGGYFLGEDLPKGNIVREEGRGTVTVHWTVIGSMLYLQCKS